MKRLHQHLSEVEVTAWVLIGIFLAVLLIFSFVFWKQILRGAAPPPKHLIEVVQLNRSDVDLMLSLPAANYSIRKRPV
jgi:hypothetical protein